MRQVCFTWVGAVGWFPAHRSSCWMRSASVLTLAPGKTLLLCDSPHLCFHQQWGKWFGDGGNVGAVAERHGRGEAEGPGGQGDRCCRRHVHSCRDKQQPQGIWRQIQVQRIRLPGERKTTGFCLTIWWEVSIRLLLLWKDFLNCQEILKMVQRTDWNVCSVIDSGWSLILKRPRGFDLEGSCNVM